MNEQGNEEEKINSNKSTEQRIKKISVRLSRFDELINLLENEAPLNSFSQITESSQRVPVKGNSKKKVDLNEEILKNMNVEDFRKSQNTLSLKSVIKKNGTETPRNSNHIITNEMENSKMNDSHLYTYSFNIPSSYSIKIDEFTKEQVFEADISEIQKSEKYASASINQTVVNLQKPDAPRKNRKIRLDDEYKFGDYLSQKNIATFIVTHKNPIHVFVKEYLPDKLNHGFSNIPQDIFVQFLILDELHSLIRSKSRKPLNEHINNIVKLFRRKALKPLLEKIKLKSEIVKKLEGEYRFQTSSVYVVLQKFGRFSKKSILRACIVNQDSFAQKSKTSKSIKNKFFFKDQLVRVESKIKIFDMFLEKKAKKEMKYLPIEWPDRKELEEFYYRLSMVDMIKGREHCLYFKTAYEANNFKHNAIAKRILSRASDVYNKIIRFYLVFCVNMAEKFYTRHLKNFLAIENNDEIIDQENKLIADCLYEHMLEFYQNYLTEANRDVTKVKLEIDKVSVVESLPQQAPTLNRLGFAKNAYLNVAIKDRIDPDLMESRNILTLSKFPDFSSIVYLKDCEAQKLSISPSMEHIKIVSDEKKKVDHLFKPKNSNKQIEIPKIREVAFRNSKCFVHFQKILVESIDQNTIASKNSIDSKKPMFNFAVGQENFNSSSWAFPVASNSAYTCFRINNFLTLKKSTSEVLVKITAELTGKVFFNEKIDVLKNCQTLSMNNFSYSLITITIDQLTFSCVLVYRLVILPLNLETAHILLPREDIHCNFKKLGDIENSITNYSTYKTFFKIDKQISKKQTSLCQISINLDMIETLPNLYSASQEIKMNYIFFSFLEKDDMKLFEKILIDIEKGSSFKKILENLCFRTEENRDSDKIKQEWSDLFKRSFWPLHGYTVYQWVADNRNWQTLSSKIEFRPSELEHIQKAIIEKTSEASLTTRHAIQRITYQIYAKFKNLKPDGKSRILVPSLSENHIDIIMRNYEAKKYYLTEDLIQVIATVQILGSLNYQKHTRGTIHSSLSFNYFQLIMKSMFSREYFSLCKFNAIDSTQIGNIISSSFAGVLDPVLYNMYQDFKILIELLYIKANQDKMTLNIRKLDLGLPTLIDILLLCQVIASNYEVIAMTQTPRSMFEILKSLIKDYVSDFAANQFKILELLIEISKFDFYITNFESIKSLSKSLFEHQARVLIEISDTFVERENIQETLLNIVSEHLLTIKKEKKKALSRIYATADDAKIEIRSPLGGRIMILEDVRTDLSKKYQLVLAYLHNFENENQNETFKDNPLISSPSFHHDFCVTEEEFLKILTFNFGFKGRKLEVIRNSLNQIFETKKYPMIEIIIAILCVINHSKNAFCNALWEMIMLVEKYVSQGKSKDDEVSEQTLLYFLANINKWYSIAVFQLNLKNTLRFNLKNTFFGIREAKIRIDIWILDVLSVCTNFANAYYLKTGNLGIYFNYDFCQSIEPRVYEFLTNNNLMQRNKLKMDLGLEYQIGSKILHRTFRFSVVFVPDFLIYCKLNDPFLFEHEEITYTKDSVVKAIESSEKFSFFDTYEQESEISSESLTISITKSQVESIRCKVEFFNDCSSILRYNLVPFDYKIPECKNHFKFADRNIKVPTSYLLSPLEDFISFLMQKITEELEEFECMNFIKIYHNSYILCDHMKKKINRDLPLCMHLHSRDIRKLDQSQVDLFIEF